jgi:tetratricopeptide (TPR) repeat protein
MRSRAAVAVLGSEHGTAALAHERARDCEQRGDLAGAAIRYQEALSLDPERSATRRQLAVVLVRLGRYEEGLALCRAEIQADGDGERWLSDLIVETLQRDLAFAGDLAAILAALQRGSEWYPGRTGDRPPRRVEAQLSVPKLRHDIEQLRYLRGIGAIDARFDAIIEGYVATLDRLAGLGTNARVALAPEDERRIGCAYGRIVHLAKAPRLGAALSASWDRKAAQRLYRERKPAVVVIDDFLTQKALDRLNRFCLESTVWSANHYADGRLGAFFLAGFNCPLLLQIAEEVRDAFPELIGARHPLRQLWGFKDTCDLPADSSVHADCAALNVNLWITPTTANQDEASGGMLIYDFDAPPSWDFRTHDERIDLISEFLCKRQPPVIRVPYRQNRAIIFNSGLFHATESARFRPDYQGRRMSVTMLYGDRGGDAQRRLAVTEPSALGGSSSRRSATFTRPAR